MCGVCVSVSCVYHEDVQCEVKQAVPPLLRASLSGVLAAALITEIGAAHILVVVGKHLWGRPVRTTTDPLHST